MKKCLGIISLCFVMLVNVLFIGSNQVYAATEKVDLQLYCNFDKNYSDIVSGNSAVNFGNKKFVEGKVGSAVYLNGDGDYLKLGTGYNLSADYSFNVWVKSDSEDRSDAALLAKYETNHYGPYDFYLSYNKPAFWVSDGDGGYQNYVSDTTLKSNEWYMLTYTYDSDISKLTMYINGKEEKSFETINVTNNEDEVTIGRQAYTFGDVTHLEYKGALDELRLYNHALSETEITGLYANDSKSTISNIQITAKKGTKSIIVSSIPNATVKVSLNKSIIKDGSKNVSSITKTADSNGKITVKLSNKLIKNYKVTVTASKNEYITKSASVTIK